MPYIPHTQQEIQKMLECIGVESIHDLFDEIPPELMVGDIETIPEGVNEHAAKKLMQSLASKDDTDLCFIGAGAYEHSIPSAVWQIASRGEFLTCYTPYQAEASQGTLQLIYEYQTMMARLMQMEVSNASLYDGATALAECVLMSVRLQKKLHTKRVLVAGTLSPIYLSVVRTVVGAQGIELVTLPFSSDVQSGGCHQLSDLVDYESEDFAALVIPQPNFFGLLEDVDALTDWAHARGALVIGVVNPIAMAMFKPPGAWGQDGADIVCGEGQPLGAPLASGGPYFGFFCCRKKHVRSAPGRIVGLTEDHQGRPGYALTLQAREQHIRRSKATSNICTNQGLLVTVAAIYMSILGFHGLKRLALKSCQHARTLKALLTEIPGVDPVFHSHPFFHEFVISLNQSATGVLDALAQSRIQGGFPLHAVYDASHLGQDVSNYLLICATETKSEADLITFRDKLAAIMGRGKGGKT